MFTVLLVLTILCYAIGLAACVGLAQLHSDMEAIMALVEVGVAIVFFMLGSILLAIVMCICVGPVGLLYGLAGLAVSAAVGKGINDVGDWFYRHS
jgi:hypothetical protein